ncbi:hypothetical protein LTR70_008173 [Exophiala xenobiotica]|uniref:Uncharacterized protein n=1 Tax=Lithohypha guttulata TaxID=1690604 RepID=A0ABR0K1Z0_9EURO|nr:hypothetical protein LTR24_007760 [Lithohypha guttulata]KAK5312492.1 hypothetical protein LTR70_008173 [Exophiala xenobiotica]
MAITRARSAAPTNVSLLQAAKAPNISTSPSPKIVATTASKAPTTDLPIHAFPSAADFEAFLEAEYATCPGFHLKFAKKTSAIPSVTAAEAVEVALCFGWIDGRANSVDDKFWLVRYTPRRAKSIWSQKNVNTVARLAEEGRMRAAGITAVEAAKADGRWEDFQVVLDAEPTAKAYFGTLNKSERYSVLWRVETASPKARQGRIEALIQMLAAGRLPGSKSEQKKVSTSSARVVQTKQKPLASTAKNFMQKTKKARTKKHHQLLTARTT